MFIYEGICITYCVFVLLRIVFRPSFYWSIKYGNVFCFYFVTYGFLINTKFGFLSTFIPVYYFLYFRVLRRTTKDQVYLEEELALWVTHEESKDVITQKIVYTINRNNSYLITCTDIEIPSDTNNIIILSC